MVKKSKPQADDDSQFANAVRSSAAQIWQAGLGAFAKAQEEGNRMFSRLVKEGMALQERSRELPGGRAMPDAVSKMASGVRRQAAGSLDKLEQVFEDRVARALATIGVPTLRDIEALAQRVEALSDQVANLSGGKAAPAAAKRARKATARAPAARPAAKTAKTAAKAPAKAAAGRAPRAAAKPAGKASATARKTSRKGTASSR